MVIWTDNAISHITGFIDEARIDTEKNVKNYINKLVDYTETLEKMPKIGKKINYEIRQIIYKKHKIIYNIRAEDIVILAVIHTRLDLNKALKNLKRNN